MKKFEIIVNDEPMVLAENSGIEIAEDNPLTSNQPIYSSSAWL